MSDDVRPRVLYITGMTRCGSTMLGNVLNEVPGAMHVGELHYLWRNGVLGQGTNRSCGCGTELGECPVWSAVLADPGVPSDGPGALTVLDEQDRHLAHRATAARVAEYREQTVPATGVHIPIDAMVSAYRVLHREQGAPVIVDGSKYPAEAAALLRRRDVDVRVLHMVRDPRATIASYSRSKAYIDRMSPMRVVQVWNEVNRASERLRDIAGDRYLQIRHEDFGHDPRGVLDRVLAFAGLPGPNPVAADGTVELTGNHTVTGNPDRLETGARKITAKDAWRTTLGPMPRKLVSIAAADGLHRYGYRTSRRAVTNAGRV